jgi:16S rRNA (cytidine1402-2'-O)-methyltransferase
VAGIIYLIPVTLGDEDFSKVIPDKVLKITTGLRYFIVENTRTSRRYLRLIDKQFPIDESSFYELNDHTDISEIEHYLEPALNGSDIGLMSEAGLPGVADPGAMIITLAHKKNIKVVPLSGPSSIVLSLISSGLNGQNFSFNGYLPVKSAERESKLRELERRSKEGYAQLFIETPYRCQVMLESILSVCKNETNLCIAADITLTTESIKTMNIEKWKKNVPTLKNRYVVFIIG